MISVEVVCDSASPAGKRLTSVQVCAHRFILAEINTHRQLSRSYRSSRAVPVAKLLEEVRTNPAEPVYWGANQKGMQAVNELSNEPMKIEGKLILASRMEVAKRAWKSAALLAADSAELLAGTGLHKQIANRVLEPFLYVHGIITATEFDNFFGLRLHKAAQPEFRVLADAMWAAMRQSEPRRLEPGGWHLPYVSDNDAMVLRDLHTGIYGVQSDNYALAKICSTARCARVSSTNFETGKSSTLIEDQATYAKLNIPGSHSYCPAQPIHASPAEHQATPDEVESYDLSVPLEISEEQRARREMTISMTMRMKHPQEWGNFVGWRQYRKMLPGEAVAPLPEGYP